MSSLGSPLSVPQMALVGSSSPTPSVVSRPQCKGRVMIPLWATAFSALSLNFLTCVNNCQLLCCLGSGEMMSAASTQEVLSMFPLLFSPSPQNKELISLERPKTAVFIRPPLRVWVSSLPGACFFLQGRTNFSGISSYMEDSNPRPEGVAAPRISQAQPGDI